MVLPGNYIDSTEVYVLLFNLNISDDLTAHLSQYGVEVRGIWLVHSFLGENHRWRATLYQQT